MPSNDRLDQIVTLVNEQGFLSVAELSKQFRVSEMTIRRDLARLAEKNRIQRTYGGAAALRVKPSAVDQERLLLSGRPEGLLVDRVDVLIATAVNPKYDLSLFESIGTKSNLPLIAESLSVQNNEETIVAVDNFQAGKDLGRWAGEYARQKWGGRAYLLDLTYYLSNTQARSAGFIAGLRETLPTAEVALSLDAQSRYDTAYQLTLDALTVHGNINLIFAVNDTTAWGAINACKDLNLNPEDLIVIPFGLEGNTLKNALNEGNYCQAGLAMYPEIVGPTCIEAAIAAYNHQPLPRQLITPHTVLTSESLPDMYQSSSEGWRLKWEAVCNMLPIPINLDECQRGSGGPMPRRIGFVVPFSEHEWYKNLTACMSAYSDRLGIEFEIVDVHQSLKDEVDLRRREIARLAAQQVQPGDVIMIDGGLIAIYLAEELKNKRSITIITNAMPVFDILKENPGNILISTGGALRHSSQMLVGPTAEGALRELRADKLFLMVTGITLDFGLSHTNISEVTMKQAMINSARTVILLADHTFFGQESMIQIAPLSVIHELITDDALPASARLDLSKLGIQIILAHT